MRIGNAGQRHLRYAILAYSSTLCPVCGMQRHTLCASKKQQPRSCQLDAPAAHLLINHSHSQQSSGSELARVLRQAVDRLNGYSRCV